MKLENELLPQWPDQDRHPNGQVANAERTTANAKTDLPAGATEPTGTKRPTLFDSFYHWVMSRL